LIADCSSGIEPWFAYSYEREVVGVGRISVLNSSLAKIVKYLELEHVPIDDLKKKIPADWRNTLVTTLDISPASHVRIQAEFQKHIDSGISKTINLPNDSTEDDVKNAIMLAHKTGCKSVALYRDGSRSVQIIERDGKMEGISDVSQTSTRKRPRIAPGYTERVPTGCGRIYVTLNEDENGLCEVFATSGKAGGCVNSWSESVTRLISLLLRSGVPIDNIVKHLRGNRCAAITFDGANKMVLSCSDAIAQSLTRWQKSHDEVETGSSPYLKVTDNGNGVPHGADELGEAGFCPECGMKLIPQEGCMICASCGFSRCG
jgi:ribonucleoside-diphosphate reductase alpha chain